MVSILVLLKSAKSDWQFLFWGALFRPSMADYGRINPPSSRSLAMSRAEWCREAMEGYR